MSGVLTPLRNEEIYESLLEDGAFADLPRRLAQATQSRSCTLQWHHADESFEILSYHYFTPECMALYASDYAATDPWNKVGLLAENRNRIGRLSDFVSDAQYARSRMFNELTLNFNNDDTFHCMGGAFHTRLGIGHVGVHRGRTMPDFEDSEVRLLAEKTDHLRLLLGTRGELASWHREARSAREILDAIRLAVIAVRRDGHILYANEAAEAILQGNREIIATRNRVTCRDHRNSVRLSGAIAAATASREPGGTALTIDRMPENGNMPAPYVISVMPLPGVFSAMAALLVFRNPDLQDNSLSGRLRSAFDLSGSETVIAIALSQGQSLREIAGDRGVSQNTLRTQMKSLFRKTDCRRQAEVAALVSGLPRL